MTPSERIAATVHRYADLAVSASGAEIAALYAPDATVEDPAGSPAHVGSAAIAAFYDSVRGGGRSIEILTLRIAAGIAAFHFRVISQAGGTTVTTEPIDVMTFDDEGRITSMRAVWSPEDVRMDD